MIDEKKPLRLRQRYEMKQKWVASPSDLIIHPLHGLISIYTFGSLYSRVHFYTLRNVNSTLRDVL